MLNLCIMIVATVAIHRIKNHLKKSALEVLVDKPG